MAGELRPDEPADVLARLRDGDELSEGLLIGCLRSPACARELIERLARCRWVRTMRRVPALLLRQPACPKTFAWEMIPRLGWHELLLVVRDPRTAPSIRRQGERKLSARLKNLTLGERTALARQATRGLIADLLADDSVACVEALLANPQFTEAEAVRLMNLNRNGNCLLAVLRNPRWGSSRGVINTAVRSGRLPFGVALGLVATLSRARLEELGRAQDLSAELRMAVLRLLERRRGGAAPAV